ncbi:MAG: T9SS type A sorting domain-containing protein [Bacteroidia bacterium]|nr:T9SS type A sorting domain-containing protein [Bacteroidia bacterium]
MKHQYIRNIAAGILGIVLLITAFDAFTSSNQPPAGYTGAPSESNCTGCHSGTVITSGSNWNNITLSTNIPATGYVPDSTYNITLSHTQSGIVKFGFEITALNASNAKAGTLILTNTTTTALSTGTRDYIMQKNAGTSGPSGTISWSFQWKAPATPAGNITFYAAVNATNNSNTDAGDQIYTKSFSFSLTTLLPTATITKSANTICTGDTLYLQGGGNNNPTIFNWTTTGGSPSGSILQNPKIVYSTPGTYNISLTTKNNIGTSTPAATSVTVNAKPVNTVTASGPLTFCKGDSVVLTASASGTMSYVWSHGPVSKFVTVKDSGNYSVTITNTANGCANTSAVQTVKVNALPVVNLTSSSPSDSICQGDSVQFTATAGMNNYLFKDAAVILQNSSSNNYKTSTFSANNRILVVATDANGCKSLPKDTFRIKVIQPLGSPSVSCGAATTSSLVFSWSALNGASGYEISLDSGKTWSNPSAGATGLSHTISGLAFNQPVNLRVRATNQAPCFKSITASQTCSTLTCSGITYSLAFDSSACRGDSVHVLFSSLSKPEYAINFNGNGFSKQTAFHLLPDSSKNYAVQMIDSTALNCPAIQFSIPVIVFQPTPKPILTRMYPANPTPVLCNGDDLWFGYDVTASGPLSNIYFIRNAGDTIRNSNRFLFTRLTGQATDTIANGDTLYVTANDSNQCPVKSGGLTLKYNVQPKPVVQLFGPILFKNKFTISFYDSTVGAVAWQWDFGDGGTSALRNPSHTYLPIPNAYVVKKLVTDSNGCSDTASTFLLITIGSIKENGLSSFSLYPNPASSEVFIKLHNTTSQSKLIILDVLGRPVSTEYIAQPNQQEIKLSIGHLPDGIYFIRLQNQEVTSETRFIKSGR